MRGMIFEASVRPGVQGQGPGKSQVESIDRCVDPITVQRYTSRIYQNHHLTAGALVMILFSSTMK